jgi:hypothetical protein
MSKKNESPENETLENFLDRTARPHRMRQIKADQAAAILNAIEDSLRPGEKIIVGRLKIGWFARVDASEASRGASARDALAQLSQVLVAR